MKQPASPFDAAADLADRKFFRAAMKLLERTRDTAGKPGVSFMCNYNLGTIHWSGLGNGETARSLFQAAVAIARSGQLPPNDATVRIVLANSCENLMLLSLSYEEYEDWSQQLLEIQPDNDILRGQVPVFLKAREEGFPWSDMLQNIALSYYNRGDPSRDPGRYGCGAATWQFLLTHRKSLRVKREMWQDAVFEYGALAMRIVSDATLVMKKHPTGVNLDECLFIVDAPIRFAEEYLTSDPSNPRISKLQANLRAFRDAAHDDFDAPPSAATADSRTLFFAKYFFGPLQNLFGIRKCEQCSRKFKVGAKLKGYEQTRGVAIDRRKLENGSEGVGRMCSQCGRIVCSTCNQHAPCPCGSLKFHGERLIYS